MTTTAQRLAAARAAQQTWKAEQADTPPPPPPSSGPKPGFAPARPVIYEIVQALDAALSDGLSLAIDDNDLYWPNGGLNVAAKGGKFSSGVSLWAASDGTLRVGGNPYLNEPGEVVGTPSAPDRAALEEKFLLQIEYASGARPIPMTPA